MKKLFVLLIGLSFFSQTLSENENRKSDLVYVDFLTNHYSLTVMDIWTDIASNTNLKDVIQKIHSEHLKLFSNSFLTSEPSHDPLLLNGMNFIDEHVADVNLKVKVAKEHYLHDSADPESLKKEILDMAMHSRNTSSIDSIYEIIIREDVFGYIKMVSGL